jgi:DNA-directed RNA polymerase specialized sigma24 family protein
MNYFLAYQRLIAKAKERVCLDGYFERHHILPRALGGTDDSSNLVTLTAKEHFVAHVLLAKIHGGIMWQAVIIMKGGKNRYFNGRLFAIARRHAFVEREKLIKQKRINYPSFDAYMKKVRSEATKNRHEGYQVDAGEKFKQKFASDPEYASKISKNRVKAQEASAAASRLRSAKKAEKILAMRADGKKYTEIMQEIGCSIGFVSKVVNHANIS